MSDHPRALDRLLDVALFAPVGLAIEARRLVPIWSASGRRELTNRIKLARMIGKFAVEQGRVELVKQLDQRVSQRPVASPTIPMAGEEPHRLADETGSATEDSEICSAALMTPSIGHEVDSSGGIQSGRQGAFPIAEYDSLSASQIVALLDGLLDCERQLVVDYEEAHRGRRTILGKAAQLQAA